MIILFFIIVGLILFVADILEDYYYIDDITGDILPYFDNNYDYNWRNHR